MGFFDLGPANIARGDERPHSPRRYDCTECGLHLHCRTPKTSYTGKGGKRILIIGGATTANEDRNNNEHHGTTYNFLKRELKKHGLDIENDCWYTHAVRCYSRDKEFSNTTKSACASMLLEEIETLDPSIIVVTNQLAWDVLLYERKTGRASYAGHYDWAGLQIPDQELERWVCPIYDPEWVMENEDDRRPNKYRPLWDNHIEGIIDLIGQKVPKYDIQSPLRLAYTEEEALFLIEKAREWSAFAFDYETTGLKPHRTGHDILAMSLSDGKVAYGFLMYESANFREAVRSLLLNDAIKTAHNNSFERLWSIVILGVNPKNLIEDTVQVWNRLHPAKPSGLKYLAYGIYGQLGYDSSVDSFIKASKEEEDSYGSNAFNKMREAPWQDMIRYCAPDSLISAWLLKDLKPRLHPRNQLPGYELFCWAEPELTLASQNGMHLNIERMKEYLPSLIQRREEAKQKVMASQEVLYRWDGSKAFSPSSDQNVRRLLFDILKYKPLSETETGLPAVGEDDLLSYVDDSPFLADLLEYRRLHKVIGTYYGQFERERVGDVIRPFFHLNKAKTARSSSSNPNFQNLPKRDEETKKLVRSCIIPRKGHRLVEYDFKGMEVSIAAHVTQDRNLMKYVSDLSKDMHRDLACIMFFLPESQVNKKLRSEVVKGPWTFAEFYGDWYKPCANNMWVLINKPDAVERYGLDLVEHLKGHGIMNLSDWEAHCEEQERVLWYDFFPDYRKWRDRTYKFFVEHGYVNYDNGFRYEGPATRNEVLNAPVQGFAFHTLLWSFSSAAKELREKEMDSQLIGQIHDAAIGDVLPAEEAWVDRIVHDAATKKVKEHWGITVPLVLEKERSAVDGDWSVMEGCGPLNPIDIIQ